jgi:hypothetical protein
MTKSMGTKLGTVAGVMLFAGALVLSLPGLRVAEAEDQSVGAPAAIDQSVAAAPQAEGASCQAPTPRVTPESLGQLIAQTRQNSVLQADAEEWKAAAEAEGFVILNNRGLNYASVDQPMPTGQPR